MPIIKDILIKYSSIIDRFDLELIIAHVLGKTREFVLVHPEYKINPNYELRITNYIRRCRRGEPLAYILGEKEFYGLKFKVNKNVLIPRSETELLTELVICNLQSVIRSNDKIIIADIGTGSGNIIIAIVKQLQNQESARPPASQRGEPVRQGIRNYDFYGIDVSGKALKMAKLNAKVHKINHKIKFLRGDLLSPIIHNSKFLLPNSRLVILANLPYLSPLIYKTSQISVKKYEPKTALLSQNNGMDHYNNLLGQIKKLQAACSTLHVSCFMEISPEQKKPMTKMIKKYFSKSKIKLYKDLSNKWRVCNFEF